ncbi:hypothetical protein [Planococcus soli]|uniref:hypothetical protein n=1 Tax=Planococcus soli TaxID=2666072 RepID=UPI00163D6924|nr:hypothetical protein [Planococcus soli]
MQRHTRNPLGPRARVSSAQALGSWHRDVLPRQLHDPHPAGPKAELICGISTGENH